MNAPKRAVSQKPRVEILGEDRHFVVIDKPSGVSSVPFFGHETDTALDLIRDAWRAQGRAATSQALFVVHRIDKATSGALVFAKTKTAERMLATQFREHTVGRTYLCVAHGNVTFSRIESLLVKDRGDGLRGSSRSNDRGKRAVTHIEAIQHLKSSTVCRVRLETGKTHQIRIHFAEQGCPLVGETVYIRDFENQGRSPLLSPRLLLHAETLEFNHPLTEERLKFRAEKRGFRSPKPNPRCTPPCPDDTTA